MTAVPSRQITSSQQGPHHALAERISRYRHSAYHKPVAQHTRAAFAALSDVLAGHPAPLVLDSGCGTGASTMALAQRHPDAWVIGVDRSAHRLAKSGWHAPYLNVGNAILLRAELIDFWRLAQHQGWRLDYHYIWYPNPWPKPRQLQRRWHGHPAFSSLLALGGRLELRSNWHPYAEEFAVAVRLWSGHIAAVECIGGCEAVSPFERKYAASGHALYRYRIDLDVKS